MRVVSRHWTRRAAYVARARHVMLSGDYPWCKAHVHVERARIGWKLVER